MSDYLKSCPFCGGMAALYANYSRKCRRYFVFAKCELCGSQGKICSSNEDPEEVDWNNKACNSAVNAWNTRTNGAEHD